MGEERGEEEDRGEEERGEEWVREGGKRREKERRIDEKGGKSGARRENQTNTSSPHLSATQEEVYNQGVVVEAVTQGHNGMFVVW